MFATRRERQLLMKTAFALAALGCCGKPQAKPSPTDREALEPAGGAAHWSDGSRFGSVTQALTILLQGRAANPQNVDFDPAIIVLTRIVCEDWNDGAGQFLLAAKSVDEMYPLDRINECVTVRCGFCFTKTRDVISGPRLRDQEANGSGPGPR